MRPVNLLPERHRPRTATGDRQGSSYIVLAVLGGVLVAALIYVLTVNQINSRRDAVTQAKADTAQANSRIQSLSAYGNFVQVKNASDHEMKLAVAVALFDDKGGLLAATESSNIGALDPGQAKEIKMTFRDVKRKFFEAKTAQVALETYR